MFVDGNGFMLNICIIYALPVSYRSTSFKMWLQSAKNRINCGVLQISQFAIFFKVGCTQNVSSPTFFDIFG